MRNKKISFILFVSILVSAVCIAVYVYMMFFHNKRLMADNYEVFEQKVEAIAQNTEKNINLYSDKFRTVLNANSLNNIIIKIINSNYAIDEDRVYLSQLLNKNNLKFSDIALYKNDGSIVFSSSKNQKPLYQEVFWDKIRKNNLEINTTYDLENNGLRSIAKIKDDQDKLIGYLVLKIPNSIFNISKANVGNYTLTETSIIYATDAIKDLNYNIALQIEPMLTITKGYIDLKEIPYKIYIASARNNSNPIVGMIIKDNTKTKNVLEYIILAIFSLSFIFIVASFILFVKNRNNVYENSDNSLSDSDLDKLLEDELESFDELDSDIDLDSTLINNYLDEEDSDDDSIDSILKSIDNIDMNTDTINEELLNIMKDIEELDIDMEHEINKLEDNKKEISNDELELLINDIDNDYENNEMENNMLDSTDETVKEDNNIYITDGSMLDSEILKMENEYFSSDNAFSFDDSDFLNIINKDDEENDEKSNENILSKIDDSNDVEQIDINYEYEDEKTELENDIENTTLEIDDDNENDLEKVPKIPDNYYKNEKIWDNILDAPYFKNMLKNKSMDDILDDMKNDLSANVDKALYVQYDKESMAYQVSQSIDIDEQYLFTIKDDEPLYTKLLSQNKVIFIDNPMESDIISSKFPEDEHKNIDKIIFVPVDNNDNIDKKDYFIILGLSSL